MKQDIVACQALTRSFGDRGGNEAEQGPGEEAGMVERLLSEGMTGTDHPRQLVAKQHLGPEAGRNPVEPAQRDIDLLLIERLRKFGTGVDDLQGYARSRFACEGNQPGGQAGKIRTGRNGETAARLGRVEHRDCFYTAEAGQEIYTLSGLAAR